MSTSTIPQTEQFEAFLGRTAGGDYITVEVKIQHGDDGREYQSVEHETVTGVTRLSIMGNAARLSPRHANHEGSIWSCGQNVEQVAKARKMRDGRGWSRADVARLVEIWQAWHLNDVTAGCAHQEVVWEDGPYGRRRPSLDLTPPCPVTGYRYGSAWLVRGIPSAVLDEVRDLFARNDA